ncbi:MAG: carbonic anhydrase [Chloroflexota bacterium]
MNVQTDKSTIVSSTTALERLVAGNQRYCTGNMAHPNQNVDRRLAVSNGQQPFAAILGCADSRVPPCVIFDQGLGDLFVIRVAGNILDNSVIGSLEFAVVKLKVSLIMVLGHADCGAVGATVEGKSLPGHLPHVAEAIQPATSYVKHQAGDLIDNTIRANANMVATQLRNSEPILAPQFQADQLDIISAYYDLPSGQVEILSGNNSL